MVLTPTNAGYQHCDWGLVEAGWG